MARLFPGALVRLCPQSHLEGDPRGEVAAWKVCGSRDVVGRFITAFTQGPGQWWRPSRYIHLKEGA